MKDNIKTITDEFIKFKQQTQDSMMKEMRLQNDRVMEKLKNVQDAFDKFKEDSKKKADAAIASGKVFSMTPSEVNQLEKDCGLVP